MSAMANASPSQVAYMCNQNAYIGQKLARERIRVQYLNRNPWTRGSVQVERATKGSPVAIMGSTELYMERQELGGPQLFGTIPGSGAAGTPRAVPRKRPQKRVLVVSAIQGAVQVKARPRGQRAAASIAVARKRGAMFAVVPFRNPFRRGKALIMVKARSTVFLHALTGHSRKPVAASPWLWPASEEAMRDVMERWEKNISGS